MAGSEEKQKGEGGDNQKPKLLIPQFSLEAGQPSLNAAVRAASLPCPSHHLSPSPIWSLRVPMRLEQTRGAHPAVVMKGKPLGRGQAQKAPELIVFGNLKFQQHHLAKGSLFATSGDSL